MFAGLIKNEFIKTFAKKKTYIVLFLFLVVCTAITVISYNNEKTYLASLDPATKVENIEEEIGYMKESIRYLTEDPSLSEEMKVKELEGSQTYLKELEADLVEARAALARNEAYDWRAEALKELEFNKAELATTKDADSKAFFESEIVRIEYHLANDIPINESSLNTAFNYLRLSITVIIMGFLAFGLILFGGDIMSGEYTPGTLKFLLIQPVTRTKVLMSKYLVTVATALGLVLGIQILSALAIATINGFGSLNLPLLVGQKYEIQLQNGFEQVVAVAGSGHFIGQGEYILKALLFEALFIATMVAFTTMVSVLVKSSVIAFTVLIATLLGTNIIYNLSSAYRSLSTYFFIHLTDVDGILTGNIIAQTGVLNFSYALSIIVFLVSTVVLLGISITVFKKRDILI